jgi:transcriptional regulator with XRE-family HTH domain
MSALEPVTRSASPSTRQAEVLSKAAVRAAAELGMSQQELANVIGVSPATMSRLVSTGRALGGKELELAGHFVRMYRSLAALLGGDRAACRAWFRAENEHIGAVPARAVKSIVGLLNVVEYLDAMRGKL